MVVESPGPKYKLPRLIGCKHHDLTKKQNPCYSFGFRTPHIDFTASPGPKYKVDHYLRNKFQLVTRIGLNYGPAYTMRKPIKDADLDPGPGPKYALVSKCVDRICPPEYTFRPKTADCLLDTSGPGPAQYKYDRKLNKIFYRKPVYSIGARLKEGCTSDSPGPAIYPCCGDGLDVNLIKKRNPKYTMASRAIPPGYRGTIPAPNRYQYNNVKWRNAPKYSFGVRYPDVVAPLIVPCDN